MSTRSSTSAGILIARHGAPVWRAKGPVSEDEGTDPLGGLLWIRF
jgi:hypothetical protein